MVLAQHALEKDARSVMPMIQIGVWVVIRGITYREISACCVVRPFRNVFNVRLLCFVLIVLRVFI